MVFQFRGLRLLLRIAKVSFLVTYFQIKLGMPRILILPLPVQPTPPHHGLDPALPEHPLPEGDALRVRVQYEALQGQAAPLEAGLKRKHSEQLWKAVNDPFASNAHFFKKGILALRHNISKFLIDFLALTTTEL